MPVDPTEDTKVQRTSGGDAEEIASGGSLEVYGTETVQSGGVLNIASGGAFKIAGATVTATAAQLNALLAIGAATPAEVDLMHGAAATVGFAIAAGASTICEVTLQAKDAAGASLAASVLLHVWLSDAATGIGLTGTTASGAVAAKASSGTDMGVLTAKKCLLVQTKADGTYILSITDAAKSAFYVAALPVGRTAPSVSRVLAGSDYGA